MKLEWNSYRECQFAVYFFAIVAIANVVNAHEGHSPPSPPSSRGSGDISAGRGSFRSTYLPLSARRPHKGQILSSQWQSFEVVYLPQETRVYVYDYTEKPFTAKGITGDVIMQVVGNPELFRNPLRYVPQPPGSREQDYVAAQVDVTKIRDGDMRVFFDLHNLPYAQQRDLRFDQPFALSGGAMPVTVAKFTEADRAAVDRQGSCPVMETGFDHGDPIKLLVGNQTIYVCCEDCIETIKKNPDLYLDRTASLVQAKRQSARSLSSEAGNAPGCSKGCCNK